MIGVTLSYKWITKNVYILPKLASWSRSATRPLRGGGWGVSLMLLSMLDLSWIDLIPVNNKIHNLLCIIKKNWGFMMPPFAPRITIWENGEGVNAAGNPPLSLRGCPGGGGKAPMSVRIF
jgi:hypothetical protein